MATERTGLMAGKSPREEVEKVADHYLVDAVQFKGWPSSTLLCARFVKGLLVCAVLVTTLTMIWLYFGGALVLQTATVKVTNFPVPQLVLCPIWGQQGLQVSQAKAWVGVVSSGSYDDWQEVEGLTNTECKSSSFKYLHIDESEVETRPVTGTEYTCACLDMPGTTLAQEDIGSQALRVGFDATIAHDKGIPDVAFGFAPGPGILPSEWAYAALQHRTLGSLEMEIRVYGATPVTTGTPMKAFTFHPTSSYLLSSTELVITPASFFVTKVKDVSSVLSVFALVSFLVLLMANMNSVGLFAVCFPPQLDKKSPQQLAPHWCCQRTCVALPCCRPLDKDVDV